MLVLQNRHLGFKQDWQLAQGQRRTLHLEPKECRPLREGMPLMGSLVSLKRA